MQRKAALVKEIRALTAAAAAAAGPLPADFSQARGLPLHLAAWLRSPSFAAAAQFPALLSAL